MRKYEVQREKIKVKRRDSNTIGSVTLIPLNTIDKISLFDVDKPRS
jgi:hypothetical protein